MKRNSLVLSLMFAASVINLNASLARAQSAQQNAARALVNDGIEFFDDGKYVDAERKFREALTKYPKDDKSDRTAYYLIRTLAKLDRVQDLRLEMEAFRRNYPGSRWNADLDEIGLELNPDVKIAKERAAAQKAGSTDLPPNAGGQAVALRQLILMNPEVGIETAQDLLKKDPSDNAVVANLGTIYLTNSPHAFPFLMDLSMSPAANPNVRETAFFFASRKNPDKEQVAQALMDMLKKKDSEALVSKTLFQMRVEEHRAVLDRIVLSSDPDKYSAIEKIYRGGSITLRTDLVEDVAKLSDPKALDFVMSVAQNDKDEPVRNAAIQALARRRDGSGLKKLQDFLRSGSKGAASPATSRPVAPVPVRVPASVPPPLPPPATQK